MNWLTCWRCGSAGPVMITPGSLTGLAYAVVRAHGETGITAWLEPATIDGLVYASSMVVLYAERHRVPVPSLARRLLALGIAATLTANMAQGWSHGPVGAVVAAWPAVSLVGSTPRTADRRSGSCTEPDPLHLALVFNLSHTTASRYAVIAQDLLDDQIEQATGQGPADQRYASDQPTEIPGP